MLNRTLQEIKERVLKDHPKVGSSIEIKLIFHDGKLQKYHYSKTDKSMFVKGLLTEGKNV